jgi:hypothetical protein
MIILKHELLNQMLFTISKWNETWIGGETVFDKIVEDWLEDGCIQSRQFVAAEQNLNVFGITRCDDPNKNESTCQQNFFQFELIIYLEVSRQRLAKFDWTKGPRT